jgi:anti-sigma factor RsiW
MSADRGPSCARVRARLERLLDGGLAPLDEARDRGHLEACADCARELERWGELLRAVRALATAEPQELARAKRALRARLAAVPAPRAWPAPLPLALAGVAAALLALLAFGLRPGSHPPPALQELPLLEQVAGRFPSWKEVWTGIGRLSRRLS